MPLRQLQAGSNTLASGDAPSQPFIGWMIKPQDCVVRSLCPFLIMNSVYFFCKLPFRFVIPKLLKMAENQGEAWGIDTDGEEEMFSFFDSRLDCRLMK